MMLKADIWIPVSALKPNLIVLCSVSHLRQLGKNYLLSRYRACYLLLILLPSSFINSINPIFVQVRIFIFFQLHII